MSLERVAPRNKIVWNPTALGANFGAFLILARPALAPAPPWTLIGELRPKWETPATYEAQHTVFYDYQAGWSGAGPWSVGWDYDVLVEDRKKGFRSRIGGARDVRNPLTADSVHWLTNNFAPFLNTTIDNTKLTGASVQDATTVYPGFMGRHGAVTRTRQERAGVQYALEWEYFGPDNLSFERARWPTSIANSGREMALLVPRGDRVIGTLLGLKPKQEGKRLTVGVQGDFVETGYAPLPAPYNGPCGVVLNGTTQYATTPDNAALNPGSGPFSIVMAAAFPSTTGVSHLSKGNLGTTDGYGFRNISTTQFQFIVDGATLAATLTDGSWPFDGAVHVAVGTHSGSVQNLYRDGGLTPVANSTSTTGAVTNAVALVAGANNGGASGFSALAPLHAWAYYDRELTATEAQAAAGWLLGWNGFRMPGGAVAFYDLRDDRCWSGQGSSLADLAGDGFGATTVAAPTQRGRPWPLYELDVIPAAL